MCRNHTFYNTKICKILYLIFYFVEDEYDVGPVRGDLPESEYAANRAKLLHKVRSQPQSDSQYSINATLTTSKLLRVCFSYLFYVINILHYNCSHSRVLNNTMNIIIY